MENIKTQLENSVQEVEDGNISAMEVYGKLKVLEKFVKECYQQIEDSASNEFDIECEGKKTIDNFKGFKIEKRNGGWNYDFSKVPKYAGLKEELKGLDEKYKQLFLHAQSVDPETGVLKRGKYWTSNGNRERTASFLKL